MVNLIRQIVVLRRNPCRKMPIEVPVHPKHFDPTISLVANGNPRDQRKGSIRLKPLNSATALWRAVEYVVLQEPRVIIEHSAKGIGLLFFAV
jgi:hypothetical protein